MVIVNGNDFGRFGFDNVSVCDEPEREELLDPSKLPKPVVINVSGLRFEVRLGTLDQFPGTLLGSTERELYWDKDLKEYFFERHRDSFDTVLYYYQSGGLINIPATINPEVLVEELKFFKIGNDSMYAKMTGRHVLEALQSNVNVMAPKDPLQRKIWLMFADPESSKIAAYVHYFDTILIMVAIATQCIETLEKFDHIKHANKKDMFNGTDQPLDTKIFFAIETLCIAWFSTDFLVRLFLCPNKKHFFLTFSNWIDFLSIIPFYLTITLQTIPGILDKEVGEDGQQHSNSNIDALMILRITRLLRVLRIARIFKMSRRFSGLFALGYALKTGAQELMLLAVLLSTCVILFSSLVFFANESDPKSPFSSVIDAFWWSVVTMSTVGYGDQVPTTILAKLVGVVCALTGILIIALPYPIIVSRFNRYYDLQKKIKGSAGSVFSTSETKQEFVQPTFSGVIFRANQAEFARNEDVSDHLQYYCHVPN